MIELTYTPIETKKTRQNKKGHVKLTLPEKVKNERIRLSNKIYTYRPYQLEADDLVYQQLLQENKCCVNMFCGTGKSLVMKKCKIAQNLPLLVYVFPSLGLIDQFCKDYFINLGDTCPFCISSELGHTTDPVLIRNELSKTGNKVICVTYQSYHTLLENLQNQSIDLAIYDEAHHCVGDLIQRYIFAEEYSHHCKKQLFFTATPVDNNGIVMIGEKSQCGKMVFKYSYLDGLMDGYLNPFEIRIDLYTENTNKSLYGFSGQDILYMEKSKVELEYKNENYRNLLLTNGFIPNDGPHVYGNGAPMATWIFSV